MIDILRKTINSDDYNFLRENEHLGKNIIFLTLGGSYAYGLNVATSDIDVRGCALNRPCDIIGMSNFEQVVDTKTDTTVYSFRKLVELIKNCNPNTIEMLGCKPEHYFYMTDIGREMIENRHMFLSKRAHHSFGGYATQQLRRLENAVARDHMTQARKEEHIRNSMDRAVYDFKKRYTNIEEGGITLYIDDSKKENLDKEIFADIHLVGYPARDFNSILNDLKNVLDSYNKLNGRNKKKDDAHLNKHACHLIRLYLMEIDILEKEEIVTYREKDHDCLMSIRNGDFQNSDGTFKQDLFDMVTDLENRVQYALKNTSLPEHPNEKRIEEFVMDVNRKVILNEN